MKILITGDNSFVGTSFDKWSEQKGSINHIDTVTLKNNEWKEKDFSEYDAIFHVAAIVHKKEHPNMRGLYYSVNRDLAVEVAKKAKASGVRQLVFMSSMAVYGLEGELDKNIVIDENTVCSPKTIYGESKLMAEHELLSLSNTSFSVAIIRAPMIYGTECPGNYAKLKKLVSIVPVFPYIENKRSMINIDKLCFYIDKIMSEGLNGIFHPQDDEYISTPKLINLYMKETGKKIYMSKKVGYLVNRFGSRALVFKKLFGNLVYSKGLQ